MKKSYLLLLILLLTSCSLLGPVKTDPMKSYVLTELPPPISIRKHTLKTILVYPTDVVPPYDTSRMAYSLRPYEINFYANNTWAANPGQMYTPLIMQTLQNTHQFIVISPPSVVQSQLTLHTTLIELQQIFYKCSSLVSIVLRAQLIDSYTAKVIATKQISVTEAAPENTPYGGVIAANRATARVLQELVLFCMSKGYRKTIIHQSTVHSLHPGEG